MTEKRAQDIGLCLRCIETHGLTTDLHEPRIAQGICRVCKRSARVAVIGKRREKGGKDDAEKAATDSGDSGTPMP